MNILHLDSSILGNDSVSRLLSAKLVQHLQVEMPGAKVTYRDLVAEPLGHLTGASFAARTKTPAEFSPEEVQEATASARAMKEFLDADVIVIGAPMYNFGISTQLKAWIDRIAVAGTTFRYTANGPEGLVKGKKVYIVSSRGSAYIGASFAGNDHQETHLQTVFNFLGITDIDYIRAEGVSLSPEHRRNAIAAAETGIRHQHLLAAV